MKLKQFVEEFVDYIKLFAYGDKTFPVFVNPTKKELSELKSLWTGIKFVRYVIKLDEKKIYVFPSSVLHDWVIQRLNIKYPFIKGSGEIKNGKIYSYLYKTAKENSWLKKYLK